MRCQVQEIRGVTIINDAYNSNPTAMQAALELLAEFDALGRRIVLSGDMGELGDDAAALHWELGKQIVNTGRRRVVDCLRRVRPARGRRRRAMGMPQARAIPCRNVEDALPHLDQAILPGDVALVKGSRMMGMERVVEALARCPERKIANFKLQISNLQFSICNLGTIERTPLFAPGLRESGIPSLLGSEQQPADNAATGSAASAGASQRSL